MEVGIQVDTRAVEMALQRAPHAIREAMEAAMEDAITDIHVQMQTYPPQQFRSHGTAFSPVRFTTKGGKEVDFLARRHMYKRRNNLRASWIKRITRQGGQILGEVSSSGKIAPYNLWVQSAQHQAAVHRGIWTNTDREVIERSRQRIAGYFRTRLRRAAQEIAR